MTTRPRLVAFGFRGLDGAEGGIETHARSLYPRLAALGWDVTVLERSRYAGSASRWSARGVRLRSLPAPRGRGVEAFVHAAFAAAYCLLTRPDVVHVHGIGPGAFAGLLRRCGRRVVVTHHGHDYDATKWGPFARAVLHLAERRSVRGAAAVIAVSQSIADAVEEQYAVRATVIANGLPSWTGDVAPPGDPRLVELGAHRLVLVVGRITSHKRILDVVDALAAPELAGVTLAVCGESADGDPYADEVEAAARDNPRVVLTGHVGAEELRWLYRRAGCTVMASSYEGMPLAVLESISAGCPVLASDIPAHRELGLAPGQYFPVGDVARLADRLTRLMSQPRETAVAVQARCLTDDRYDWDRIAEAASAVLAGSLVPSDISARMPAAPRQDSQGVPL